MEKRQEIAIAERVSDRTPRPLMGPLLTFDLVQEADSLRSEESWQTNGHNARTLIKHAEFRLVLLALQQGARVKEHQSTQRVAVQTLSGCVRLHVPTEVVVLSEGQLMALERDLSHDIEALEESVVLLWVGWSKH
jgi:quercetin dioxygenase-like cupin family protein